MGVTPWGLLGPLSWLQHCPSVPLPPGLGVLQHRDSACASSCRFVVVATIRPSVNKLILSFTVIRDCGSKHLLLLMSLKVG